MSEQAPKRTVVSLSLDEDLARRLKECAASLSLAVRVPVRRAVLAKELLSRALDIEERRLRRDQTKRETRVEKER